jgi:hypothetical protein
MVDGTMRYTTCIAESIKQKSELLDQLSLWSRSLSIGVSIPCYIGISTRQYYYSKRWDCPLIVLIPVNVRYGFTALESIYTLLWGPSTLRRRPNNREKSRKITGVWREGDGAVTEQWQNGDSSDIGHLIFDTNIKWNKSSILTLQITSYILSRLSSWLVTCLLLFYGFKYGKVKQKL